MSRKNHEPRSAGAHTELDTWLTSSGMNASAGHGRRGGPSSCFPAQPSVFRAFRHLLPEGRASTRPTRRPAVEMRDGLSLTSRMIKEGGVPGPRRTTHFNSRRLHFPASGGSGEAVGPGASWFWEAGAGLWAPRGGAGRSKHLRPSTVTSQVRGQPKGRGGTRVHSE